jgi:hypothetical protein
VNNRKSKVFLANRRAAKSLGPVNSILVALLASLVVASARGESPEQTKVRITTWNLEWFPNGSAHDATPEVQAQRIAAAADVLRPINADIILLQEVRDYEACAPVSPHIHPIHDFSRAAVPLNHRISALPRLEVGACATSEGERKRHEECESVNHARCLTSLPARYKLNLGSR